MFILFLSVAKMEQKICCCVTFKTLFMGGINGGIKYEKKKSFLGESAGNARNICVKNCIKMS